jgi:putative transposase
MISFKGTHFPKDVILYAVFFYVRYGVSYRDLEEIMEERGVNVDHATRSIVGLSVIRQPLL